MRWDFHWKESVGLVLFVEEIIVYIQFKSIINLCRMHQYFQDRAFSLRVGIVLPWGL